jgi:hypothetical protein
LKPTKFEDFTGESRPMGEQTNFRRCPVCNSYNWKVYVDTDTGLWICFAGACGARGKVSLARSPSALRRALTPTSAPESGWPEIDPPHWNGLGPDALLTLMERYGMTREHAQTFSLREMLDEKRILIPYFDENYRLIYYSARSFDGSTPKYKAAPGRRPLYVPRHTRYCDEPWVIVEGEFDAMKVCLAGYKAVALGGKELSKLNRIPLLDLLNQRALIALDPEAFPEALKLQRYLSNARAVRSQIVRLTPGEDPGSLTTDELKGLLGAHQI